MRNAAAVGAATGAYGLPFGALPVAAGLTVRGYRCPDETLVK
jgi:hypothetical protein